MKGYVIRKGGAPNTRSHWCPGAVLGKPKRITARYRQQCSAPSRKGVKITLATVSLENAEVKP